MLDVLSGNFMFWQYETLHFSHLVCEAIKVHTNILEQPNLT